MKILVLAYRPLRETILDIKSLTASLGEKQSEDLLDWKQFETYIELKGSNNYFRVIQFHEREKFEQLNRDFKKIKTKILELRGEYVTKELDSVTSIAYLPVALWVSRVILKITRIKPNGTRVTYYIDTVRLGVVNLIIVSKIVRQWLGEV